MNMIFVFLGIVLVILAVLVIIFYLVRYGYLCQRIRKLESENDHQQNLINKALDKMVTVLPEDNWLEKFLLLNSFQEIGTFSGPAQYLSYNQITVEVLETLRGHYRCDQKQILENFEIVVLMGAIIPQTNLSEGPATNLFKCRIFVRKLSQRQKYPNLYPKTGF